LAIHYIHHIDIQVVFIVGMPFANIVLSLTNSFFGTTTVTYNKIK
ncbi:MAG: hypothetical protein ACI9ES_001313, partial [Oceanospirillaceae bacterium]